MAQCLQRLKAALDVVLASFARRREEVTALWDRLLRSVVIQPRTLLDSSLPKADLTYQLNEIEVTVTLPVMNDTFCSGVSSRS